MSASGSPFPFTSPVAPASVCVGTGERVEKGDRLGHYEIDGRLGARAMGVVYRATDLKLRRRVAIKFLRSNSPAMSPPAERAPCNGQRLEPPEAI